MHGRKEQSISRKAYKRERETYEKDRKQPIQAVSVYSNKSNFQQCNLYSPALSLSLPSPPVHSPSTTVDTQALSLAVALPSGAAMADPSAARSPLGSVSQPSSIASLVVPKAKDTLEEDAATLCLVFSVLEPSAGTEEDPVLLT